MNTTEQLCKFVVETQFEDIPEKVVQLAKERFLDCLGATIAGYSEEPGRIITEYTCEIMGRPEARLVGSGLFTSAANAALANGIMAHVLDFDDTGFSHPTGCILPVLLALGEKLKTPGREILAAQIMGYECFRALSYGARTYEPKLRASGFHPTPIWGTLAAGATAAKLLKMDTSETRMVLGLAGSQAMGLTENFGTMTKGLHSGNAARGGILAALLVKNGYTASQEIIEGERGLYHAIVGEGNYQLDKVTENLGKTWALVTPGLPMKRYPCCGGNLEGLDAILHIIREHNVSFDQVKSVEAEISPYLKDLLRFDKPTTGYEAKFSLGYSLAVAALDGKVDIDSFKDEKVNSPEIRQALNRINIIVRPPEQVSDVGMRRVLVKVKLKSGQEYTKLVERQAGRLKNPVTHQELLEKYCYCAKRATLSEGKIERSIELVENLEKLSNILPLMDAVTTNAQHWPSSEGN